MFKLFGRKEIVKSEDISQLLDRIVTPELENHGFKFDGGFKWVSDKKDSVRKVVYYQRLKGATGILSWGICLDFVPSIVGSSIKWNRTEKSSTLHLFEQPLEYAASFCAEKNDFERVSHWGKNELKITLKKHFARNRSSIYHWFSQANDIDDLIRIAENQVSIGVHYKTHHPKPEYILMFLYGQAKRVDEAMQILNKLKLDIEIKSKLAKLLNQD